LTPYQKLLWHNSAGRWHGIARVDIFRLADGSFRIAEMNSDTPSGEAEAVTLNQMLHDSCVHTTDPNSSFRESFMRMILESHAAVADVNRPIAIGIIYPTEMPEDLSMISLYRNWMEQHGYRVVLGSPYNIRRAANGRIVLFDTEIDILLRHYKTDWWTERVPVWSDELPFPDAKPLARQLQFVLEAEINGLLTVVNPFGSILTQNKLSMAFFWQHIDEFSAHSRESIQELVPRSIRLSDAGAEVLNKDDYVLKSDYGCEGDEVIIGRDVSQTLWEQSLMAALPDRWILQERFEPTTVLDRMIPNYGVFLVGGRASGIYTRLSRGATDHSATTLPTFVESLR
jgi:glutathionylspermidine synthase